MKTLTFIISLTALFFCMTTIAVAQTNHYIGVDSIRRPTFTYNVAVKRGLIYISNRANIYDSIKERRLDGKPIKWILGPSIEIADPTQLSKIFNEVLGVEMKPNFMTIDFTANTNGDVIEVSFMLRNEPSVTEITPEKYYELETKIKQRMKFILSEDKKKQNIVKAFW